MLSTFQIPFFIKEIKLPRKPNLQKYASLQNQAKRDTNTVVIHGKIIQVLQIKCLHGPLSLHSQLFDSSSTSPTFSVTTISFGLDRSVKNILNASHLISKE